MASFLAWLRTSLAISCLPSMRNTCAMAVVILLSLAGAVGGCASYPWSNYPAPIESTAPKPSATDRGGIAATVQRSVDAYNAHDIERFATEYADDAEIVDTIGGNVLIRGKAQLKEHYGALFRRHPNARTEILSLRVQGDHHVLDRERASGAGQPFESEIQYEIKDQLIVRVWVPPKS